MLDAGGLDARLGLVDAGFDLGRGGALASVPVIAGAPWGCEVGDLGCMISWGQTHGIVNYPLDRDKYT